MVKRKQEIAQKIVRTSLHMLIVAGIAWLLPLDFAYATELVTCTGVGVAEGACDFEDIFCVLIRFFDFLLINVTAPLATLVFIVGGLILMFGGSNPALINRAKAVLKGAVIGVGIVLLSWIIVNTTINILTDSDEPDGFPWPWHDPDVVCQSGVPGGGGGGAMPI